MSVLRHRIKGRPRVPRVEQIREAVRTAGPAASFDWGCEPPSMSMTRIAALPEPEWARPAYTSRHRLPLGWLRTVDMIAVASSRSTLAENLAAIAGELGRLGRHTVAMALAPVAHGTYDHRPLNAPVGRELGAEDTVPSAPRLWDDGISPEELAEAAQRDAVRDSWRGADFGPTAGPLAAEAAAQDALLVRTFGTEVSR